jgi:hypothetical protein
MQFYKKWKKKGVKKGTKKGYCETPSLKFPFSTLFDSLFFISCSLGAPIIPQRSDANLNVQKGLW